MDWLTGWFQYNAENIRFAGVLKKIIAGDA